MEAGSRSSFGLRKQTPASNEIRVLNCTFKKKKRHALAAVVKGAKTTTYRIKEDLVLQVFSMEHLGENSKCSMQVEGMDLEG